VAHGDPKNGSFAIEAHAMSPAPSSRKRSSSASRPTLDSLDATHREILAMLAQLDRLMVHLVSQGCDGMAQSDAAAICAFFASTARQHHEEEERIIFPQLLARDDSELVQQIQRLQQDHGWLEEDWLELAPVLQAIAQGQNVYDVETLREGVNVFTNLYHEHIALEDTLVYPAARQASERQ
jgi:hemerythrin-like domain-containing protein